MEAANEPLYNPELSGGHLDDVGSGDSECPITCTSSFTITIGFQITYRTVDAERSIKHESICQALHESAQACCADVGTIAGMDGGLSSTSGYAISEGSPFPWNA